MPDQTRSDNVVFERDRVEISKTDSGISVTDTDNRSRSLDVNVDRNDSSVSTGVTWKLK